MLPPEAAVKESAGASPIEAGSARWVRGLMILLLLAAAAALRLQSLARKPFWFDECFSTVVAGIDWRKFLHLLWWREANMSLYYVLLRAWLDLSPNFGQSEFFIRSLSVLIAVATLPALYWLARLLYNARVALIATALLAFNAYHVRYAQEARTYALFVLLATLSSGFLIASLREPSRRYRVGYIVCSILAVYAHFYALLLVLAHCLTLRWFGSPRPNGDQRNAARSSEMQRAWTIIGIAVLPLLIFVAKTGAGPIRWIPRATRHDLLVFYENFCGSNRWPLGAVFAVACLAAVVPVAKQLFARDHSWETWRCQFLLVWLLFPIVLTVLLSFARPVFLARYMIFCLPALVILVAAGLARLRQSWLLAVVLTGILFLSSQGIFFVYGHDFDTERDASGAASNFILDHTEPGDGVVFHIPATRVAYEFFRSVRAGENTASPACKVSLGPEILFPHHATGLDYRDFTGKPTADFLQTLAIGHPRVWVMLMNNGSPASPDPTTVMLTKALSESFPKVQTWQLARVEVRLYSKQ
jgi:mannosyltransferase